MEWTSEEQGGTETPVCRLTLNQLDSNYDRLVLSLFASSVLNPSFSSGILHSFLLKCRALARRGCPPPLVSVSDLSDVNVGHTSFTESASPLLPPLSEMEATHYYVGLPSSPRLLARTSTTPWERPRGPWGPEAYLKLKQLGVVFSHKLSTVWEDKVAPKVHVHFDELGVDWTSTDLVRIGKVGDSSPPVILWIGVKPKTLTREDANIAALSCLNILLEFNITDVHVEIRESSVTRSASPKLLPPVFSSNPTVDVRHTLTHALSLPISAQATPFATGTGGFFMAEGGDSNKLLLITARHVVLPLNEVANDKFKRKDMSEPRFDVLLLGDKAYGRYLASIMARIAAHATTVEYGYLRIKRIEAG